MEARMKNPAMALPDVSDAIQGLVKAAYKGGVSPRTRELVHLRASQINGCSACVDSGGRNAKKSDETDERLWSVAAWREPPYFSDAERPALTLAEYVTPITTRRAGR
jgi:AhpD family alkylhydroperoxidase